MRNWAFERWQKLTIATLAIALLAMAGCSSSTTTTDSTPTEASASSSASTLVLTDRTAVRGELVKVPADWTMSSIDAGGSGSGSIWVNPQDPSQWIEVTDGVEAGGWCDIGGVKGAIDPTQLFPEGTVLKKLSKGKFSFEYPGKDFAFVEAKSPAPIAPAMVKGIWLGSSDCLEYLQLSYALPGVEQAVIDGIMDDFEQQNQQG